MAWPTVVALILQLGIAAQISGQSQPECPCSSLESVAHGTGAGYAVGWEWTYLGFGMWGWAPVPVPGAHPSLSASLLPATSATPCILSVAAVLDAYHPL